MEEDVKTQREEGRLRAPEKTWNSPFPAALSCVGEPADTSLSDSELLEL